MSSLSGTRHMAYDTVILPMPSEDVIATSDWCATVMSMNAAFSSRNTAKSWPFTFVTKR